MRIAAPLASLLLLIAAAPPSPPPAIRLDQIGFEPTGPKIAILVDQTGGALPWRLADAGGHTVESGTSGAAERDPASGDTIHRIDFSAAHVTGDGFHLIAGRATSRPFPIRPGQWAPLFVASMSFFTQQRSGIAITRDLVARPDLARPAGHRPDRATCFAGVDERGTKWPGCTLTLDASGGWYDAGDQGKYVVNGGISLWTLLDIAERSRRFGGPALALVADGTLKLPERGNGVPDVLDEARWELKFLLAMQVPQGTRLQVASNVEAGGPLAFQDIDASGLVFQKIADEHWTGIPTAPADDREQRFLYPPTTAATLNLAAVAAKAARLWRGIDDAFAAQCLDAARRAFAAAEAHPDLLATSSFTGSGGYGDRDVSDEAYWAAAELYLTTGETRFANFVRKSPHWAARGAEGASFGWGSTAMLGTLDLATVPSALPQADRNQLREAVVTAATAYSGATARGYGLPYGGTRYGWGSTSDVLNHALVLGVAFDLTRDRRFRDAAVDAADFVLGRNPLDVSFVTGFGVNPMEHPHHRFWAHQADPRYPMPPAGVISGGPNAAEANGRTHPELRGCAPQRCWIDDYRAFTVNEVAINWNAPLAWLAAFLAGS